MDNQQVRPSKATSTTNTLKARKIEALSYITGVYLGDGCAISMPKFRQYIFQLSVIDKDFVLKTQKEFEILLGKGGNISYLDMSNKKIKRQNQWSLRIYSKRIVFFLRRITQHKNTIPRYVTYSSESLLAFIAGVMDSEGFCSKSKMPNGNIRFRIGIKVCDKWILEFREIAKLAKLKPSKIIKNKGKRGKRPSYCYYFELKSWLNSGCYFNIKRKQDRVNLLRQMVKNNKYKLYHSTLR